VAAMLVWVLAVDQRPVPWTRIWDQTLIRTKPKLSMLVSHLLIITVLPTLTLIGRYRIADDPNEISFTKGEVLDIVDKQGKWWQRRRLMEQ